jgi:hypothetical protein
MSLLQEVQATVGFQARFFWQGSGRRFLLAGKGLQKQKPRKSGKLRKKVSFCLAGTPVFLQKQAFFEVEIYKLLSL